MRANFDKGDSLQLRLDKCNSLLAQERDLTSDTILHVKDIVCSDQTHDSEVEFLVANESHEGPSLYTRLAFSDWARSQFYHRLGVSPSYMKKCPKHLQMANLDHWINVLGNKKILLRNSMMKHPGEGERIQYVRAVFSRLYNTNMDNRYLFPLVFKILQESEEAEEIFIKSFEVTPEVSVLRVLFPQARVQHDSGVFIAGLMIINSEVGRSSIYIKPIIHGGMIGNVHEFCDSWKDGVVKLRHVGELNDLTIKQAIHKAERISQIGIHRLLQTSDEMVNPTEEIETFVSESSIFSDRLVAIIEDQFQEEQECSRLQVAQGLLSCIKTLPLFQQIHAQAEVGRYLDLFRNTEDRFKHIIMDIKETVGGK